MKFLVLTVLLGLFSAPSVASSKLNLGLPTTTGVASWYGKREQGKRTASGERFDRMKYTAASRFYLIGTLLMVQYPRKGTFVVVRVNDHGPFKKGRVLDLSERAAQTLELKAHGVDFVVISPVHFKLKEIQ